MIVVDTSALVAIVNREPRSKDIADCAAAATVRYISGGTLSEFLILAAGRGFLPDALGLVAELGLEVVPVDRSAAEAVGDAYLNWGKGQHPARLNFGDCFAYALAISRGLPLLYVGGDFAQTDVRSAL